MDCVLIALALAPSAAQSPHLVLALLSPHVTKTRHGPCTASLALHKFSGMQSAPRPALMEPRISTERQMQAAHRTLPGAEEALGIQTGAQGRLPGGDTDLHLGMYGSCGVGWGSRDREEAHR